MPSETDLYEPVKLMLAEQGYDVKGEIGDADVFARRGDDPILIVELKNSFSLALYHQAVERLRLTDAVYIAVLHKPGPRFAASLKDNVTLCRRLGLGLITVDCRRSRAQVQLDPGPYQPRKSRANQVRLLLEFSKRVGDPTSGGATRRNLITAYRQDALRCVNYLLANGPAKAATVADSTSVSRARRIMADNYYGWFERVRVGFYALTPDGKSAAKTYDRELARLAA